MRELKRIIVSKTNIVCIAFLIFMNVFIFFWESTPKGDICTLPEYTDRYIEVLNTCKGMDNEEGINYLNNLKKLSEGTVLIPRWLYSKDMEYKEEASGFYYKKYGEQMIKDIESGKIDTSEQAVKKAYITIEVCNILIEKNKSSDRIPRIYQNNKRKCREYEIGKHFFRSEFLFLQEYY